MYINGARRGDSLMEDTQVPNTEVIASVFPDDSEVICTRFRLV